jgi:hypothetical protein
MSFGANDLAIEALSMLAVGMEVDLLNRRLGAQQAHSEGDHHRTLGQALLDLALGRGGAGLGRRENPPSPGFGRVLGRPVLRECSNALENAAETARSKLCVTSPRFMLH